MSYIRNLLEPPNGWTRLNRNINEMKRLSSCCYFFSLKTGCKLIALFEALVNLIQMYCIFAKEMDMNVGTTTTQSSDSLFVTREPDGEMLGSNTAMPIFEFNTYFAKALNSLTIFRSILLIIGAECGHTSCLILWLCITAITLMLSSLIHILQDNDLQNLPIRTISIFLEIYFCAVVLSLVLKLQEKLRLNVQETEVLYTHSGEA
ncbi:uncharacterized protein LOC108101855 [Drosophila ficusphila]|uniref:uncharacterized protein LOC108101855 n=1 Tax=Drosophila ficusphila TaxID=30025 RepID=UPI0007E6A2A3|nr:uncharacterized protein LOC108101855 [Drosophila ficusphila]